LIPHSRPFLDSKDSAAVARVIKYSSDQQLKIVGKFEEVIANYIGVRAASAVNSGTSALHLGLLALGIKPKDEVILPSYVCTAPLNAINYVGAIARICDINEKDFNISVKEVKKKINKKTKAIIVPHMFGLPADLDDLLNLGIPLIEDCAHSIGATYRNKKVGSFGIMSVFSFYSTKMLSCGEGGMVCSDSSKLINKIKDLRQYDQKDKFAIRFNYKMTALQAALGLSQFSKLDFFIKRRRELAAKFNNLFLHSAAELPSLDLIKHPVYYRYVVRIKQNLNKLLEESRKQQIFCRRPVYKPIHRYLKLKGYLNTEQAQRTALSIPFYPCLTEIEIAKIKNLIKNYLQY